MKTESAKNSKLEKILNSSRAYSYISKISISVIIAKIPSGYKEADIPANNLHDLVIP
jgi:hypothetical protein